ncbi:hypothetical protein INT47_011442 [Mucor saturninus]|uniref:Uncharacterized protein n=1 Tax=Mucor saturninus TaxID=64648 RepID=A0A8H7QXB8_9FUNG|nr:hypothetical protein INT47_011442 [Mucor saturninus]
MDILRIFLTANPASSVKNLYDLKSLTEKDIFNLVIAYIPNVGDSFTANQINKWLTSDGYFGRPKSTRQGCDVIKARSLWVLKPKFMVNTAFATGKLTKITPWNISANDTTINGLDNCRLLQEVTIKRNTTKTSRTITKNVFVSPICRASSDLLTRDISPTATAQSILKQLRFQNGDMQDFLMFAKQRLRPFDWLCSTTLASLQISLMSSPLDVKTIEQIVIDYGHKLESFNRAELNNRKVILKFDCRKAPVK